MTRNARGKTIEFEFVFDPHDEFFGMTEKQWESLHEMKVKVTATRVENDDDCSACGGSRYRDPIDRCPYC